MESFRHINNIIHNRKGNRNAKISVPYLNAIKFVLKFQASNNTVVKLRYVPAAVFDIQLIIHILALCLYMGNKAAHNPHKVSHRMRCKVFYY